LSGFQLVNDLCLSFVKELECGFAHIQDQCLAAIVVPDGSGFYAKTFAIESD
jgi:hypothetical protein